MAENSVQKPLIGMIGMGWVGGSHVKDFRNRGYDPICYSMDEEYVGNRDRIKDCDIVFIAVPTPTRPEGFDDSILRSVIKLVGKDKIAVIKSTVTPGTTNSIQEENPDVYVFHVPEFLSEVTAEEDAAHPMRNIVGMPKDSEEYRERAKLILDVLPQSSYNLVCSAVDAEFIKYARNCVGFLRVVFYNLMYDAAGKCGVEWRNVMSAIAADPDNGPQYTQPIHKTGRGAGGHCFIKDFAAFADFYEKTVGDSLGVKVLRDLEKKNVDLLLSTDKDLKILEEVYGDPRKVLSE